MGPAFARLFCLLLLGSVAASAFAQQSANFIAFPRALLFTATGPEGGPFTPDSFTGTFTCGNADSYRQEVDASWVSVAPASGPCVTGVTSTASINENANSLAPGDYTATVTTLFLLRGQVINTQTDTINLEVTPAAPPPVCSIDAPTDDPVRITAGETIRFSGSITDPSGLGGTLLNWSFEGGNPGSSTAATVNVTYDTAGEYTAQLTGSDGRGQACAPVSRTVIVSEVVNNPPICTILSPTGTQNIQVGDSLNFTGSVIDPDNDPVFVDWRVQPSSGVDFSQANPADSDLGTLTFNTAGNYSVLLQASDSAGAACEFDLVNVIVEAEPVPGLQVSISADRTMIETGETVNFSSTVTPPEIEVAYQWSVTPATGVDFGPIDQPSFSARFDIPDDYSVRLQVTAADQPPVSSTPITITVREPVAPPLNADFTASAEGDTVIVDAAVRDSDLLYSWTFGDGASPAMLEGIGEFGPISVRYTRSGSKTITLQVSDPADADREPATQSRDVDVEEASSEVVDELLQGFVPDDPAQQSVTSAIAVACTDGGLGGDCDALIQAAESGQGDTVREVIAEVTPKDLTISGDAGLNSVGMQISNIAARLVALRQGTVSGLELGGLSLDMDGTRISGHQMQELGEALLRGGSAGDDDAGFSRLGVFVSGRISRGDRDATLNSEGFDYDVYGLTVGADYRVRDDLILGAALGYTDTSTDIDNDGGKLDSDGWSATFYGSWYRDDNFFVDGSFTYGTGDYSQGRNMVYTLPGLDTTRQTFNADFDGDHFGIALNAGYEIRLTRPEFALTPNLRLQYIRADIDGFRESATDPGDGSAAWAVEIDDQEFTSFTSGLGVQASYTLGQSWGVAIPFVGIEWVHEFEESNDDVTGRFIGDSTGTTFRLPVDDKDSNYFNLDVGVSAQFTNGSSGFVNYRQVLGYDDLDYYTIDAGVRFEF